MGNRAQRFGIRIGRGWAVLFLIAGGLLLGAYWLGPLRPIPAHLQMLAIEGNVAIERVAVEPRRTPQGGIIFPIPIAVRNVGAQEARPSAVVLSVPPQFRISTTRGRITGNVTPGVPLRRFPIALERTEIEPDSQTQVLPGLDTIYLEPDLPRYYCTIHGPQIPEFISAPEYDPQTLSDIRIFYSFDDALGPERQTGLLTVELDPQLLDVAPAPNPPTFPTVIQAPEARAPETGTLLFDGARTAHCGDAERPVELYTTAWETLDGGTVLVVYVDNVGRKRLYDMNGDGIIELETWDSDGDGRFEARREARYAIPDFLMPLPPRDPSMAGPDPLPADSAWLALFHSPRSGLDRFAESPLVAHPPVAVADTTAVDSAGAVPGEPAVAAATRLPPVDVSNVRPATPAFLSLFADTAAGPFRFSQRPRAPAARTQGPPQIDTAAGRMGTPATPTDAAEPVEPEPEPEPEPAPEPE
ncbi:MAG TPA: hypothetical protein VHG09_07050, partial [Longimicrobiales bacterium]|nr:hypothetical protein [Longimicrobiales bacterium]